VLTWAIGAVAVAFLGLLVIVWAFIAFFAFGCMIAHGCNILPPEVRPLLRPTALASVLWLLLVICIVMMNRTWKAHPESRRWQHFALVGLLCVLVKF
jgi:NADH:ubiquinone oxidoreductase subunit 6 (subunit J)